MPDTDEYTFDSYGVRYHKLDKIRIRKGGMAIYTAAQNREIYNPNGHEFHLKTVTLFNGDASRRKFTFRDGPTGTQMIPVINVGGDNYKVENFDVGPIFTNAVYCSIDAWTASIEVGVWGNEIAHTLPLSVPS